MVVNIFRKMRLFGLKTTGGNKYGLRLRLKSKLFELTNFQRDHLLHEFYERDIPGDRTVDCVPPSWTRGGLRVTRPRQQYGVLLARDPRHGYALRLHLKEALHIQRHAGTREKQQFTSSVWAYVGIWIVFLLGILCTSLNKKQNYVNKFYFSFCHCICLNA